MASRLSRWRSPLPPRPAAILLIGLLAGAVALGATHLPGLAPWTQRGDDLFYDGFYRLRPLEDQNAGPVLIVAVDQRSLDAVDKVFHFGWPWPREFWGQIATYLDQSGARAIGFDILFKETSAYQNRTGDDDNFAAAMDALKTPVVYGAMAPSPRHWDHFAPPIKNPRFGAVNIGEDKIYRAYRPSVNGQPSLATALVQAIGQTPKLPTDRPFLLHYYGPYAAASGRRTFRYISAANVLTAQLQGPDAAKAAGITPDLFRNKIVLLGAITAGTYDLKSSPLSAQYPGVEVQATAAVNLLQGQAVHPLPAALLWLIPFLCAGLTSAAVIAPRRAWLKLLGPVLVAAILLAVAIPLFRSPVIRWLPPTASLVAIALATLGAFAWTYFAEDRQRRFMLKALSKVVSPAVAEQLAREPQRLALGTVRGDITVLFTDLANFTDMSESMDVQKLGELLNRYLGEMSDQVLRQDGTLDKYIGDAVMCFWNAPLPQIDHAARACRAALAMVQREREIAPELQALGAPSLFTRIGINTASVAVGFVGSSHLFNYTALGDGVNLASRLEGANKFYGTRILISETTAQLVKDQFILRKVDVLRVKGKRRPMAVYELLAERDDQARALVKGYESAFASYQRQDWRAAEQELLELQRAFSDDKPIAALLRRITTLRQFPPPPDWDGVYEAKEK